MNNDQSKQMGQCIKKYIGHGKSQKQAVAICLNNAKDTSQNFDNITVEDAEKYLIDNNIDYKKYFIDEKQDQSSNKIKNLHLDAFDSSKMMLTDKITRTSEGYLKGRAIVTNTGIFNYLVNGKVIKELRDNDEVFKSESLESLKNKPITDNHPDVMINSDNIKKYQVGFTGSDVQNDGHAVSVDITITDKNVINKIESGKRAFSCGYSANLDYDVMGKYFFGNNPVDCRQKDIMYNHVAIVDRGRAGELAKLPMTINDSMDNINIHTQIIEDEDKGAIMEQKIKIDGVDYNVDKDVAKYIHSLTTDNTKNTDSIVNLQKKLSDAEAKRDAYANEIETLKADAEKNKLTDAEVQSKVKERIALEKVADTAKVEYNDETSNKEIKLAVIKTKNDKFDETDRDDVYIDAYFDAVKTTIKADEAENPAKQNKQKVFSDYVNNKNDSPEKKITSKQKMHDEYVQKIIKQSQDYRGAVSVD